MQMSKVNYDSAPRLLNSNLSRALSFLTCSSVQEDPPKPPSYPAFDSIQDVYHPCPRIQSYQKIRLSKTNKAVQNSRLPRIYFLIESKKLFVLHWIHIKISATLNSCICRFVFGIFVKKTKTKTYQILLMGVCERFFFSYFVRLGQG